MCLVGKTLRLNPQCVPAPLVWQVSNLLRNQRPLPHYRKINELCLTGSQEMEGKLLHKGRQWALKADKCRLESSPCHTQTGELWEAALNFLRFLICEMGKNISHLIGTWGLREIKCEEGSAQEVSCREGLEMLWIQGLNRLGGLVFPGPPAAPVCHPFAGSCSLSAKPAPVPAPWEHRAPQAVRRHFLPNSSFPSYTQECLGIQSKLGET